MSKQNKNKTGFIAKLEAILSNQQLSDVIAWNLDGNSFSIHDVSSFENVVLSSYFRHKRMSSFIRQLNMYGFHKQRSDKQAMEFHHPLFKKQHPQLFQIIERKKASEVSFKENQADNNSRESQSYLYMSDRCMPSIKVIEPESEYDIRPSFRLNGSKMTIRLNEGLTSLCEVDFEEQLPLERGVEIMPVLSLQEGEEWSKENGGYQGQLVSIEEQVNLINFF